MAPISDDKRRRPADLSRTRQKTLNRLRFPAPTREFEQHRDTYGDTPQLSANQFFYGLRYGEEHRVRLEPGVELLIGPEAVSETRRPWYAHRDGHPERPTAPVQIRDRAIGVETPAAEKADPTNNHHSLRSSPVSSLWA